MSFAYADFEDIVPGGTVPMLADHANELRLAIIERADAIGVDVSLIIPAAISSGDPIELSWLTGMRTAIETIVDADRYGLVHFGGDDLWTAWTLATLLTEVHATFTNCGSGSAWISVLQGYAPLATHIRELFYACEVLAYAGTNDPVETINDPKHDEGYGEGETSNEAWANAQSDYDSHDWQGGWVTLGQMLNYGNDGNGGLQESMHDERSYDTSIIIGGVVDVKELWIANWFSLPQNGPYLKIYKGADFAGDELTVALGKYAPSGGSGIWYRKHDLDGVPLGPTDEVTISYKLNFEMYGWGSFWELVEFYNEIGQYAQAESEAPFAYLIRPQFVRSKFLWTMPTS